MTDPVKAEGECLVEICVEDLAVGICCGRVEKWVVGPSNTFRVRHLQAVFIEQP